MSTRRAFLRKTVQSAAIATSGGMLWSYLVMQNARAEPSSLRPPGAVAQDDFSALCIKCGRCVAACPFDTLKLAAVADRAPMGTPYFEPRSVPCYLCEDIPCKEACPTGALDPGLEDVMQSRMGLASIDVEHCLSWQGLRCEICYRVCPLREEAISVEARRRGLSKHAMLLPFVHSDACTGCGICENACPTQIAAIRVMPAHLIQGKIGDHYRLGWRKTEDAAQVPSGRETQEDRGGRDSGEGQAPGLDYLNRPDF